MRRQTFDAFFVFVGIMVLIVGLAFFIAYATRQPVLETAVMPEDRITEPDYGADNSVLVGMARMSPGDKAYFSYYVLWVDNQRRAWLNTNLTGSTERKDARDILVEKTDRGYIVTVPVGTKWQKVDPRLTGEWPDRAPPTDHRHPIEQLRLESSGRLTVTE
jgi:hypothetical protein